MQDSKCKSSLIVKMLLVEPLMGAPIIQHPIIKEESSQPLSHSLGLPLG